MNCPNNHEFKPNDIVKTCKYLEKGLCFQLAGLQCCVHGSKSSPVIVSTEEINKDLCTHSLIVERKKELFLGINGKKEINLGGCKGCTNIIEKKFKDVSLF